jgi:hypothetical protein
MEQKYAIRIYESDVEKYSTEISTEDIHDDLWDIISDAITAAYPDDRMSEPNEVTSRKAYESAEFDETGFAGYFGIDDACMITATRI